MNRYKYSGEVDLVGRSDNSYHEKLKGSISTDALLSFPKLKKGQSIGTSTFLRPRPTPGVGDGAGSGLRWCLQAPSC